MEKNEEIQTLLLTKVFRVEEHCFSDVKMDFSNLMLGVSCFLRQETLKHIFSPPRGDNKHIYFNLMFEYHVVSLKIHQENLLPILSLFTQMHMCK